MAVKLQEIAFATLAKEAAAMKSGRTCSRILLLAIAAVRGRASPAGGGSEHRAATREDQNAPDGTFRADRRRLVSWPPTRNPAGLPASSTISCSSSTACASRSPPSGPAAANYLSFSQAGAGDCRA